MTRTRPVAYPRTDLISLSSRRRTGAVTTRVLRNPLAIFALTVLAVATLVAIFAPLIAPYSADQFSLEKSLKPPSAEHWLGTDRAGRDLLSRLILAAPMSLIGGVITLGVTLVIGLPSGLVAGYRGGLVARVGGWFSSLILAMPAIAFLLAVRAVFGPSIWVSMIVFGIIISPQVFKVVENAVRNVRNELYVDAAKVTGLSDMRIISRHILRVVAAPILVQAAFIGGAAIAMQASLEFLGIGDPAVPTWGGMLNAAFAEMFQAPWQVLWPALAIGLLSGALIFLANAISDASRPRAAATTRGANTGFSRASARRPLPVADPVTLDSADGTHAVEPGGEASAAEISGLSVAYGEGEEQRTVVRDVSLQIRAGEVLGLVGESGSGKTQTALSLLGLLPAGARIVSGEISVEGRPLSGLGSNERRKMLGGVLGYVPQEPMTNLDPSFRVGEQVARPLRLAGKLSRTAAKSRTLELFEQVGIRDVARVYDSYPHQISGGIAQRVLIAGAVANNPHLLVADEPTTALDVTIQAEVLEVLRRLQHERGMSILLVTHNFGVVADLCDRVAVMSQGRIVEQGAVRDILRDPRHEYTQMLLSSMLDRRESLVTDRTARPDRQGELS